MAKVAKKLPKKKTSTKDHSEEGVKVSVVKKDNFEKTEEVIKDTIGDGEDEEELEEKLIKDNMALVGMSKGYSYNMGNYESARISCSLKVPCKNDDEAILDEYNRISELLDEQLEFESSELLGEED